MTRPPSGPTPESMLVSPSALIRSEGAAPLTTVRAFGWRAFLRIKHVPEQLGDVVGIPVMFTLLFTYLFGGAVAGSTGEYLRYLLPGSIVMAVLMVSIYSGVTLNTDVATGVFDRFRSLPIWRPAPILGGILGDLARYVVASAIVVGLGLVLGWRPDGGAGGVISAVILVLVFASALSWVWTTLALLLRTPSAVMNMGMLILFPLTFVSNVFVDPATTPGWLEIVIDANPVSHLVTAVRKVVEGSATAAQIGLPLIESIALLGLFAPLTIRLYIAKDH